MKIQNIYKNHVATSYLSNASFKLPDHTLTAVNIKYEDLKITRNGYFNVLRNETWRDNFENICNNIKRQNQKLSSSITERHRAPYLRDNIKVYYHQQHSRRFMRAYRKKHKKERKLLYQKKIHEDFLFHAIWLRNRILCCLILKS